MKDKLKGLLKTVGLLGAAKSIRNIVSPNHSNPYKIQYDQHHKDVFTEIYNKNAWASPESVSGRGSELRTTKKVISDIASVIDRYSIKSILDIPCGDFNWMKEIGLENRHVSYVGCDIVPALIERDTSLFAKDNIKFEVKDLIEDPLPKADLIICRDCLVHFSYANIAKAIKNIKKSGSTYILLTSFIDIAANKDIKTGEFRPISLLLPPFNFKQPVEILVEEFTEDGFENNKSLFLYKVADLDDSFSTN